MTLVAEIKLDEALEEIIEHLRRAGIQDALSAGELMLMKMLGCRRLELHLKREAILPTTAVTVLEEWTRRRIEGEPLQYILGETEFYGLIFRCDHRALIPRPETEILLEEALKLLGKMQKPRVMDLGTGSGVIAVTLAVNTEASVTAVDSSFEALELASYNSMLYPCKRGIYFLQADVFAPDFASRFKREFDLFVSNPPYVSAEEWAGLDRSIREFEPREALTDGGDGLSYYGRFAEILPYILREGGYTLMEVSETHWRQTEEIMSQVLSNIEIIPDLAGKPRVLRGRCFSR